MRRLSFMLLSIGTACEAFSYWGVYTIAGRRAFDEMDGIIPVVAAPVGVIFLVSAAVVWWRSRDKS